MAPIKISTRHGQISDETQARITEKITRLLRLYERIGSIDVTIDLERRDLSGVDLRISAKQKDFVATSQAEDLMAAVDDVVEKMEQQLRKHKEKLEDRHRGPGHHE